MMTFQKSGTIHALCIFLTVYVPPYLVMSRIGFWRADNITNIDGFFFVEPTTPCLNTVNECCRVIFAPLTWIDNALGTGRPAASFHMTYLSQSRFRAMRSIVLLSMLDEPVVDGSPDPLTRRWGGRETTPQQALQQ